MTEFGKTKLFNYKELEKSFKYWEKNYIKTEIFPPKLYYDFYGYHWDYNNNGRSFQGCFF